MTRSAALPRAARDAFLSHLAETSNVAASARKAKLAPTRFYAERRRSEAFRAAWQEALCEGFARLEAELLAEALRPAKASDPTAPTAGARLAGPSPRRCARHSARPCHHAPIQSRERRPRPALRQV
jgi:hypothetical protein